MPNPHLGSVPAEQRPRYREITGYTNVVCRTHLTEEYASLAREMAAVLCGSHAGIVDRGNPKTWACGIVLVLGRVNFLFDSTCKRADLCSWFGVKPSTGEAKATKLWKLLDLLEMEPRWCLPSRMQENPVAWLVEVDGAVVDARTLPVSLQEELARAGLIPDPDEQSPA